MKNIFLILISIFLFSCAQIQNPTGGSTDTTAPKITKAKPNNQSTNFTSDQKIEITFNEFIKLNNLSKELIVSPPLTPIPTIRTKGKKLIIDLSECKLEENTTYSIFMGDALVDYNEGNPLRNFSYVFSTGNTIDSLYVIGSVIDMETGFVGVNTSVLLYSNLSDTFLNTSPSYLAKTDSFGRFKIENLPKKEFKLLVIQDENNNKKPDNQESIAYIDQNIIPDTNTIIPILYLSKPITIFKQSIKDTFETNTTTKLLFSKAINAAQIEVKTENNNLYKKFKIQNDTLILFQNRTNTLINVYNSDTLFYTSNRKIDSLDNALNPYTLKNLNFLTEQDTLLFTYPYPINKLTSSKFNLIQDSIVKRGIIKQKDPFTLAFIYPYKESKHYTILYDYSLLNTMDTTNQDSIEIYIRPNNSLGTIICKIDSDSTTNDINYILQLIQNKQVIREKLINSKEIEFPYLKEGIYTLKVIVDTNKDGKWNTGNRSLNIQPEKIIHYKNKIEVKENWDLEVNIGLE